MNSIERFSSVLAYQKPDKLPLFIPTVACSVAAKILGREAHTGSESLHYKEQKARFEGDDAFAAFEAQYYQDTMDIAGILRVDVVRDTWRQSTTPAKMPDEYTMIFGTEGANSTDHIQITRYFPKTETFGYLRDDTIAEDPDEFIKRIEQDMAGMMTAKELRAYEESPQFEEDMRRQNRGPLTVKAMAAGRYPAIASGAGFGFPVNHTGWLQALALYPEVLTKYHSRQAQLALPRIRWMAAQGFPLLMGGMDLAGPMGMVFSPRQFEAVLAPAYKIVADECKRIGVAYTFGTDGNYMEIADIIYHGCGIRISIETEQAAGMTVAALRKKYPDWIVFGAINSGTLHLGTVSDVRKEVRRSLDESEGVQYVPGPSNSIMPGTPVENVFAMIEEIER